MRFLLSILGFWILRANIACAKHWFTNFQVKKSWHLSKMPKKIHFCPLWGKNARKSTLKNKDLVIFELRTWKNIFLIFLDTGLLVGTLKLTDHWWTGETISIKMQNPKIESKNYIRHIFSQFFNSILSFICVFQYLKTVESHIYKQSMNNLYHCR